MCDKRSLANDPQERSIRHTQILMEEKLRSMKLMQLQRQIERKMILEQSPEMQMQLARIKQLNGFSGLRGFMSDLSWGSGSMHAASMHNIGASVSTFLSSLAPGPRVASLGRVEQPCFVRSVYVPESGDRFAPQAVKYALASDYSESSARFQQEVRSDRSQGTRIAGAPESRFSRAPGPYSRQVSLSPTTEQIFSHEHAKALSLRQAILEQELEELQHQKNSLLFPQRSSIHPQHSTVGMQQEFHMSRQSMAEMALQKSSTDQKERDICELVMQRQLRSLQAKPEYMTSVVQLGPKHSLSAMLQLQGPLRSPLDGSRMLVQGAHLFSAPGFSKQQQRQVDIQGSASVGGPQNSQEMQHLLKEAYRVLEEPSGSHEDLRTPMDASIKDRMIVDAQHVLSSSERKEPQEEYMQLSREVSSVKSFASQQESSDQRNDAEKAPVELNNALPSSRVCGIIEMEDRSDDAGDDARTSTGDEEECTKDREPEDESAKKIILVKLREPINKDILEKVVLEKRTPRKDPQWMYSFEMLKAYKESHGDCIVPRGYAPNPPLGSWVAEQRKQYKRLKLGKNSTLTTERIGMLETLNFAWDAQQAAWDGHFQNLIHFKKKNGHCHVSLGDADFPKLGLWVKEQRRHYGLMNTGGQTHMNEDRVKQLEEVGFCWDTQEATWLVRFLELTNYRERYGDCLVPESWAENPLLSSWVLFQRRQYKRLIDGEVGHYVLTQMRIDQLNSIGFVWDPEDNNSISKKKRKQSKEKCNLVSSSLKHSDNYEDACSSNDPSNDGEEYDEECISPLRNKRKLSHNLCND